VSLSNFESLNTFTYVTVNVACSFAPERHSACYTYRSWWRMLECFLLVITICIGRCQQDVLSSNMPHIFVLYLLLRPLKLEIPPSPPIDSIWAMMFVWR